MPKEEKSVVVAELSQRVKTDKIKNRIRELYWKDKRGLREIGTLIVKDKKVGEYVRELYGSTELDYKTVLRLRGSADTYNQYLLDSIKSHMDLSTTASDISTEMCEDLFTMIRSLRAQYKHGMFSLNDVMLYARVIKDLGTLSKDLNLVMGMNYNIYKKSIEMQHALEGNYVEEK